jgi:hypothetical protein
VKLMKADGTDRETDRESRKLPAIFLWFFFKNKCNFLS